MKPQKRLGRRAAVVLVCAALMVTAAVAAAPTAREAIRAYLGAFAPYAQTIDGVVCTDQGIEVEVLSAISDDMEARFYLAIRDVEQDRLNESLRLVGKLSAGEENDIDSNYPGSVTVTAGVFDAGHFELISYDPETKTALFSTRILYMDTARPTGKATLSLTGMNTLQGELSEYVSCASVTESTLESLNADGNDKVVLSPGTVEGIGYTDDVLPSQQAVLAPGQTPLSIEGTEVVRISSMGFASDGCFHVRLEFAEGTSPWVSGDDGYSMLYAQLIDESGDGGPEYYVCQERLVEDGMDILFPLLTAEDAEEIQLRQLMIYGCYARPGVEIAGDWSAQFEMDYYPSVALNWTGELAGWQVRQVTVSPLSVTMNGVSDLDSTGGLGIHMPIYAVKKDGSTVAAESSTSQYSNVGAMSGGEERWEAFVTWKFEEPVDVEDLVSLTLEDAVIPVD